MYEKPHDAGRTRRSCLIHVSPSSLTHCGRRLAASASNASAAGGGPSANHSQTPAHTDSIAPKAPPEHQVGRRWDGSQSAARSLLDGVDADARSLNSRLHYMYARPEATKALTNTYLITVYSSQAPTSNYLRRCPSCSRQCGCRDEDVRGHASNLPIVTIPRRPVQCTHGAMDSVP